MKILDPALLNHLGAAATSLAWCWLVERQDGESLGFTNYDQDLVIAGLTYQAATGFAPSAYTSDSTLSVNNQELTSILDAEAITESDLLGGKYDAAKVSIFLVNTASLPSSLDVLPIAPKHVTLATGYIGEVRHTPTRYAAELRSLSQKLQQRYSQVTSKLCRYDLGDSRCGVNLSTHRYAVQVISITNNRTFQISGAVPTGVLSYGTAVFTSGDNDGWGTIIAQHLGAELQLFELAPFFLAVNDTLTITAGCDKTIDGGCTRFGNQINFGGEPHIPGPDEYFRGPD
ncbi:MAG: DUF2163 domain-containing protein [Acaryochloridaceae cyanobacterium SU_2_1]|nr:DUF2163 domain-containing protein [Acaryochloridaceae cyanobacterium SU_2_1]